MCLMNSCRRYRDLHSFPTRRSSDLIEFLHRDQHANISQREVGNDTLTFNSALRHVLDRKSTRLNSSHMSISYAVSCLKKKTSRLTLNSARSPSAMRLRSLGTRSSTR